MSEPRAPNPSSRYPQKPLVPIARRRIRSEEDDALLVRITKLEKALADAIARIEALEQPTDYSVEREAPRP